jgi:threonine dehydratase
MTLLPTISDVEAAASRIAGIIAPTPVLTSPVLDARTGACVLVKAECLQRFGSFKLRGAANKIASLETDVRARGVLAFSSGNHAIATAAAARHFGVSAAIVMPADAPAIKRERTLALGGEVIAYDRVREDREAIGAKIAAERGLSIVKPFDDPHIIAGQGTAGLELAAATDALDCVLVCASGGGLAAGIALAVQAKFPHAHIYAVEPEGHDDIARSLASGVRESNAPGVRSICDALLVDRMGALPFAIAQQRFAGALTVSDAAVRAAVRFAFAELKLVLEPSGAAALAALLSGAVDCAGKSVGVIASGGNVDAQSYAQIITG